MSMALLLGAGALGALSRYGLSGAVQARIDSDRPWGTGLVNVSGAILLGMLVGLQAAGRLPSLWVRVLGTGFAGGYTTFSTWMMESVGLAREGRRAGLIASGVNVFGMLAAGLMGAALAEWVGRRM